MSVTAPARSTPPGLRDRFPRSYEALLCLTLALASLLVFAYGKIGVFPGIDGPIAFDGNYYTLIGERGYSFSGRIEEQNTTAFLPLMGFAIQGARFVIPGHFPLAEVATLGFVILLLTLLGIHRLTYSLSGSYSAAGVAIALWALSPIAFYNFVGYADPLYALLTVWTLLLAVKERYWGACMLAGLAMLTRPQAAVLVIFVIGMLMLQRRAEWRSLLSSAVPAQTALTLLPILLFSTYCAIAFGDSAVYVNSLEAWRNGSFLDGNLPVWKAVPYFVKTASEGANALSVWTIFLASTTLCMVFGLLLFALNASRTIAMFYVATLLFLAATISFDAINFARHMFFLVPWVMLAAIAHVRADPGRWIRIPVLLAWIGFSVSVNLVAVGRYYRGEWVS